MNEKPVGVKGTSAGQRGAGSFNSIDPTGSTSWYGRPGRIIGASLGDAQVCTS